MRRVVLSVLLLLGVAMIVTPLATGMFGKTKAAHQMMGDFRPIMQPASVDKTVYYMNNVFAPLRPLAKLMNQATVAKLGAYMQGMQAVQTEAPKLVPLLAKSTGSTPEQVQQMLAQQYPALAQMFTGLPQMTKDFAAVLTPMGKSVGVFQQVPAGLDHYHPIVLAVANNVDNFKQADSLPRMDLFPWFFIIPGALLVLLSGWLLVDDGLLHIHLPSGKPAQI
jgi:hypothetical protein